MTDRPNRNVTRGEATRAQLIAVATRLFASRGYEDTSIEAVLREAGVSRGSLYPPSVLGWERWRALDERPLSLIRTALQAVADDGILRPDLVDTLAHVVLASVNEVALLVARSDDPAAAMQAGTDTIDELLQRLLTQS